MTIHLDHKHELSLKTVAPELLLLPSPSSLTFYKRPFPPTALPACSRMGPSVPTRHEAGEPPPEKRPRGQAKEHLHNRCGCRNLLLDGDKQRDVLSSSVPAMLGRKWQSSALLTAKPVQTVLNLAKTFPAHSLLCCTCYIDLEIDTANLVTPLRKHIYSILKVFSFPDVIFLLIYL